MKQALTLMSLALSVFLQTCVVRSFLDAAPSLVLLLRCCFLLFVNVEMHCTAQRCVTSHCVALEETFCCFGMYYVILYPFVRTALKGFGDVCVRVCVCSRARTRM
jgi:hypothetical protein